MTTGMNAGQTPGPNPFPSILWSHILTADARDADIGHKKSCVITTTSLSSHSDWSMFLYFSLDGQQEKKQIGDLKHTRCLLDG